MASFSAVGNNVKTFVAENKEDILRYAAGGVLASIFYVGVKYVLRGEGMPRLQSPITRRKQKTYDFRRTRRPSRRGR